MPGLTHDPARCFLLQTNFAEALMTKWKIFICFIFLAPALFAQYREIPLPFTDTTRFKVQFIDEMRGWVSSYKGSILQTTDGGVTWREHRFLQDTLINDIVFVNDSCGWIVVRDCGYVPCYRQKLYRTIDGGETWESRPFPDSTTITSRCRYPASYKYEQDNISFLDKDHIVFDGFRRGMYSGAQLWYTTSNGGETWDSIPAQGHDGSGLMLFVKDTVHWMYIRYTRITDAPKYAGCFLSSNAGASWRLTKPWSIGVATNAWQSDKNTFVLFNCPDTDFSSLHPGTFVTTDGGETWNILPYHSAAKMGIMPQDTTLWVIDVDLTCDFWKGQTVDGYLYRIHPNTDILKPLGYLMYTSMVRWIDHVNKKVFALTTDGHLIVFDDLLVSADKPDDTTTKNMKIKSFYPNPCTLEATVTIDMRQTENARYAIIDLLGRTLVERNLDREPVQETQTLHPDLHNLPTGMYRFTVWSNNKSTSKFFIKKY
jgi:hypothetical protein